MKRQKRSSAEFLAYDLRPAKQAERRILIDYLNCTNAGGATISDCRCVCMGGTQFYDGLLMHRYMGVREIVSLERNVLLYPRAKFNAPFDFVKVSNLTTTAFLNGDKSLQPTIYWLDYDDGISANIYADIDLLGTKVLLGGAAFVTVSGNPPGALLAQSAEERLLWFQDYFAPMAGDLKVADMERSNFPTAVYKVLFAALKNAFAARGDGRFHPSFRIIYNDSVPMVTVGGHFCSEGHGSGIDERLRNDLPFLFRDHENPYEIENVNLTGRERALFDLAVTKSRKNSFEANLLHSLGFDDEHLAAYKDLIRFLPRYVESIV